MFWSQANLESVGWSLISEFIGIGVTVLVIDRLLKRQERTRWNAARNSANARLFSVVDGALLRAGVDSVGQKLPQTHVKTWGNSTAVTSADYSHVDVSVLRKHFRAAAELQPDFELLSPTEAVQLREPLSEILSIAGDHLPPEIHALVLHLNDQLRSVPGLAELSGMDRADIYASMLDKVLRIRDCLSHLATRSEPL